MRAAILLPTDIAEPGTGEPLYVSVRPISFARHLARALSLFVGLVWDGLGLITAFQVARIVHPLAEWRAIRRAAKKAEGFR